MQILAKAQLCTQNSWVKLLPKQILLKEILQHSTVSICKYSKLLPPCWYLRNFLSLPVTSDSDTLNFFILFISWGLWTSDTDDENRTLGFLYSSTGTWSPLLQREPSMIHLLLLAHCSSFWLFQATFGLGTSYLGMLASLTMTFWCIFFPQEISCDISVSIYFLHCDPTSLRSLCKHHILGCSSITGLLICCICIFL